MKYKGFNIVKENEYDSELKFTYNVWTVGYDGRLKCWLVCYPTLSLAKEFCQLLLQNCGKQESYTPYQIGGIISIIG